jgi:hypothetical protein
MKTSIWIAALGVTCVAGVVGFVQRESAPGPISGAVDSPPTVRVAGLMINGPTRIGDSQNEELAFRGSFAKTRLALELHYPKGGLIDLQREGSTLVSFSDDKGTNLLTEDDFGGPFEMLPRISEDSRELLFVIGAKTLPNATAAQLRAQGSVRVMVADAKETHTSATLELVAGTPCEVGPFTFSVSSAGPSEWSEAFSITLESKTDLSAIVRYALVDQDGNEIALQETMSMSGMGSWQQSLDCEKPVETAQLRIECWTEPEIVDVPFEVRTGLGLR